MLMHSSVAEHRSASPLKKPLRRMIADSLLDYLGKDAGAIGRMAPEEQETALSLPAGQLLDFIRRFEDIQMVAILNEGGVQVIEDMARRHRDAVFTPQFIAQMLAKLEPVQEMMQQAMRPLRERVRDARTLIDDYENDRQYGDYHVSSGSESLSSAASMVFASETAEEALSPLEHSATAPAYRNRTLLSELALEGRPRATPTPMRPTGAGLRYGRPGPSSPIPPQAAGASSPESSPVRFYSPAKGLPTDDFNDVTLDALLQQKEQQIRRLRRELATEQQRAEKHAAELVAKLDAASDEGAAAVRERSDWQRRAEQARAEAADAQQQVARHVAELERLHALVKRLQNELAQRDAVADDLENHASELEAQNSAMLDTMKLLEERTKTVLDQRNQQIEQLSRELSFSADANPVRTADAALETESRPETVHVGTLTPAEPARVDCAAGTDVDLLGFDPFVRLAELDRLVGKLRAEVVRLQEAIVNAPVVSTPVVNRRDFRTARALVADTPVVSEKRPSRALAHIAALLVTGVALLGYTAASLAAGAISATLLGEYASARVAMPTGAQTSFYFEPTEEIPNIGGPAISVGAAALREPEFFELALQTDASAPVDSASGGSSTAGLLWRPSFLSDEYLNELFSWLGEQLGDVRGSSSRGAWPLSSQNYYY